MRGVCPCSNPVITRPKPLRQRNGRRAGRRGGKRNGLGQEVEQGVCQKHGSGKMTFSLKAQRVWQLRGIWTNRVYASFSMMVLYE